MSVKIETKKTYVIKLNFTIYFLVEHLHDLVNLSQF